MAKVAPISERKSDHIKINLEQDVRSALSTGLENYRFIHEALPEIDLDSVDTSIEILGKRLAAPILISSMTGGTQEAETINLRLAESAQNKRIAMGVGSQRAAIENPHLAKSFKIRKVAPDILLFANLGAIQLNYGYTVEHCRRAIDMIEGDALFLHLNPLQEAVQAGGDTHWAGLASKIEKVCSNLDVPVFIKEVGWGISARTAKILVECGVAGIDVAGAGGTSWSQVEMYRAKDKNSRDLAATFIGWGIPTAESIRAAKEVAPEMMIIASGGLKDGLDIAKCIALGASLGGMAGHFLRAAAVSGENIIELINLTWKQIQVSMFATGARTLMDLSGDRLAVA